MDLIHLGLRGLARCFGAGERVFQRLHAAGGAAGNHALAAGVFAIAPVCTAPRVSWCGLRCASLSLIHI